MTDIDQVLRAGRRAWPTIDLPRLALAEHVTGADVEIDVVGEDGLAELYLAVACCQNDAEAVRLFREHYLSPAAPAIAALRLPVSAVAEVEPIVMARLRGDEPGGSLIRYAASGQLRGRATVAVARAVAARHSEVAVPDLAGSTIVASALAELTPRVRNALRMHLDDAVALAELAILYGVAETDCASWLADTRALVVERVGASAPHLVDAVVADVDDVIRQVLRTV